MKSTISRRRFFESLATAAFIRCTGHARPARAEAAAHEKLFAFRYSDVKLTGGPLKAQFDRVHAYYQSLDEDALLKAFRQRAGLPAPGAEMGGWYGPEGYAPGHSFGQYVSGLARFAEATGDAATRAKAKRLVEGFAATVGPDGYSYMSLRASTAFPAYTFDKNLVGLLEAFRFAGVTSAREMIGRVIQGSLRYLPPRAVDWDEAPPQAAYDEPYTLPENLFHAYELAGNNDYRELARKYLMDQTYFDPLARGVNVLPGRHAYSHVNALSSAAKAYQVLGESKYLEAIRNAWDMIETTQQFASGGWGPNETFVEPHKGKLGDSLATSHNHFETPCGAYAHMKLARYLLSFTGEARYGDGLERIVYNTVLGAKDPKGDGHFFYYSDYHRSAQKGYHPDKWPCCSGTLPQVVADYLVSAYFGSEEGLYVNLYAPSEVRAKIAGVPVRLLQETGYPETETAEFRLELPAPIEFTLYLRIPGWLRAQAEIAVNSKAVSIPAEPGTFAALRRRWANHDTVAVTLPFSFRTVPVDEHHPQLVALMRGPLMLVAIEPVPKLMPGSASSRGTLKAVPDRPQSFELLAPADRVRFVPFYTVEDEAYTTYVQET